MPKAGPYSPRATSIRSATTADAVGPSPAPAPWKKRRPTKLPSATTAFSDPSTWESGIGWDQHRVDTLEQPILTRFGHAHQADSETQRCSFCDVGRDDMADACNVHLID